MAAVCVCVCAFSAVFYIMKEKNEPKYLNMQLDLLAYTHTHT